MPTYSCGLFCRDQTGRQSAELIFTPEGLGARTKEGQDHLVPWNAMRLEVGGASANIVFIHHESGDLTLYMEGLSFLDTLAEQGNAAVQAQVVQVKAQLARARKKTGWIWFSLLTGFILLGSFVPMGFRCIVERSVQALPISVDKKIGKMGIESMDLGGTRNTNSVVKGAMDKILVRISPAADNGGFSFRLRVIENDQLNAFALPGGELVVFTGLLEKAENPEEVAGVIAHEMAHVVRRHGMQRIAHSIGAIGAIQLIFGDVGGLLALAKEFLTVATVNNYSQENENEADAEGVKRLARAGLDPKALVGFFRQMKKADGASIPIPGWLSTHPAHDERIKAITALTKKLPSKHYDRLAINWQEVRAHLRGNVTQQVTQPPSSKIPHTTKEKKKP